MPTPEEIEAAAGIEPPDEITRKRIWAAAQFIAGAHGRAPGADDLRVAEGALDAAHMAGQEHLSEGRGQATITLTDAGMADEIDVAVEFVPELQDFEGDEVGGTPAQILALGLLEGAFGDDVPQTG